MYSKNSSSAKATLSKQEMKEELVKLALYRKMRDEKLMLQM
jgi:hypothetical protein